MSSSKCSSKYFKDCYFQQAQQKKLRSRSWFKLQSVDFVNLLFHRGMTVIDLGSSPGGWSSYIRHRIGNTGNIIACDVLPMKEISGVLFLKEDCTDPDFLKILLNYMKNKKAQVVLSDMSPNTTGISIIDVHRSLYLGKIALNICRYVLVYGGDFLVKIFQGKGFEEYVDDIRFFFKSVKICKPQASRSTSREVYVLAKELKCK